MTVCIVTDNSSCLSPEVAAAAGVEILDLHVEGDEGERTTAALGQLELAAAYGRLVERSNDDGVVALHLSRELSITWANATAAAGVFNGQVRVLNTKSAGMVLGFAALAAADEARRGASLTQVEAAARRVIRNAHLWLYVAKLDALRKGGRLSTGQSILTTALAARPIFQLVDGKLGLAGKARTPSKAMDKLYEFLLEAIFPGIVAALKNEREATKEAHAEEVKLRSKARAKQKSRSTMSKLTGVEAPSDPLAEPWDEAAALKQALQHAQTQVIADYANNRQPQASAASTNSAAATEASSAQVAVTGIRIALHQHEDPEILADFQVHVSEFFDTLAVVAPHITTEVVTVELSPVLAVHTGPGALGVVVYVEHA